MKSIASALLLSLLALPVHARKKLSIFHLLTNKTFLIKKGASYNAGIKYGQTMKF